MLTALPDVVTRFEAEKPLCHLCNALCVTVKDKLRAGAATGDGYSGNRYRSTNSSNELA